MVYMALNGVETVETCAICQNPHMRVRHGHDVNTGCPQHDQDCPECGESNPYVLYDCQNCYPDALEE